MKALADRGYPQAVLPPHERPDVAALRSLGFTGDDATIIARAARDHAPLLAAARPLLAMWAANAANREPVADTADRRVHFTPANLMSHFHRAIEAPTTTRVLRAVFADESASPCTIRCLPRRNSATKARPTTPYSLGPGGARHRALCLRPGRLGDGRERAIALSGTQTREASQAIARRHGLDPARTLFAQQTRQRSTPACSTTT
jgi:succinylarginine dihydrolase